MSKITIAGIFYSGYKDIWHDFISLFKLFWPGCQYDFVIVSDTEGESVFDGVKVLNAGKDAEYSKKVRTLLNEVDSDYYLLLLEDFFFSKKIDESIFDDSLLFMETNGIDYYAMPLDEFSGNYKGRYISRKRKIKHLSTSAEYTVSCQPAIWKKEFLDRCVGYDNFNAWVFEGIYKESRYAHTKSFLNKCAVNTSNPLHLKHGALQSKLIPDTVDFFKKHGYKFVSGRETLSKTAYRKMKFKICLQSVMPYWLQKAVRKVLFRKSITDKYKDSIETIMKNMELY